jgi:hypothetical protein
MAHAASRRTEVVGNAFLAQQFRKAAEFGEKQLGAFCERKEAATKQRDQLRLDGRECRLEGADRSLRRG